MFLDSRFDPPRRQRVAAYAVIVRGQDADREILLSRLAPYLAAEEQWTLPGGGVDFGEHPREAVVREVHEETGLHATVGDVAWIDSARRMTTDPTIEPTDMHSVRMVFQGRVSDESAEPRVMEVDGSTVDAGWHRIDRVLDGSVPTVSTVRAALESTPPRRRQRLSAYAVIRRGEEILLTRISARGHHPGAWTLPGGGVDHGESPADALVRELAEETGLTGTTGALLGVHDVHFVGRAPDGDVEDFHGVHLLYDVSVAADAEPHVVELDGTTDAVAWIPVAEVQSGAISVLEVVHEAL